MFLVGFRIGLNVTNSNVIDVGYAGVIGADRLADGVPLYGHFPSDNEHGDTYGPVTYEAYVPFEQIWPWSGSWDDLEAAHAAAIAFDLLCVLLIFLVGRAIRGPGLGVVLAYAWVTYPFTIFASNTNTNDSLVAVFVLAALLAAANAPLRGVMAALGGLTKFASLALAPLLATHSAGPTMRSRARSLALFAVGFARGRPARLRAADRRGRGPAHGLRPHDRLPGRARHAVLDLGPVRPRRACAWRGRWPRCCSRSAIAFVRRRPDVVGLAACAAAVLIAVQAAATYWFYLYIVWFFPLVMVALLGPLSARRAAAPARSRWPAWARRSGSRPR